MADFYNNFCALKRAQEDWNEFSQDSSQETLASDSASLVTIDIEGAVVSPGVYKLPFSSIVQDALVISGGLFVLETVSVILQVFVYKRWKKRIFKMAPIHHHFELKGWPEPKVIVRFWIISIILALVSLATLKLR